MVVDHGLLQNAVRNLESGSIRARWVVPVSSPPIEGGVISIRNGQIVGVGDHRTRPANVDLGNVAILPAFVNAHTHLEFSDLQTPLGVPGICFPDWIREILRLRRDRPKDEGDEKTFRLATGRLGLEECLSNATVAIGEIATLGWNEKAFLNPVPYVTIFHEFISLAANRIPPLLEIASQHIEAGSRSASWRPGLSPHAPYTVHWDLLTQLCSLSKRYRVPVAMHLAETKDELELLATHQGSFRQLLDELNVWNADAIPRGAQPVDYLQTLALADRALVIHGNYLNADEHTFLARHRDRMSVVFCPRTHAYFGHSRYPLAEMLARGVSVCVGTDSRASNPSLSIWEELRFIATHYPEIAGDEILSLGTCRSAAALGLENKLGCISPGAQAAFAVVPLPERCTTSLYPDLFAATTVHGLFRAGDSSGESGSTDTRRT